MQPTSSSAQQAASEGVAELLRAPADPAAAAALVGAALGRGGADERTTLRALRSSTALDAILGHVPLAALAAALERPAEREQVWELLDLVRRSSVLRRIERTSTEPWARRILAAIDASDYTVGAMFRQRVEAYGSRVLFQIPEPLGTRTLSWRRAAARMDAVARGLVALDPERPPGTVGILSENRIEMALLDLACLTSGLLDVMIPANATEADVGYMLAHSRCRTVVVSSVAQLRKVQSQRERLPDLVHVVALDRVPRGTARVLGLDEVVTRGERVAPERLAQLAAAVRVGDLATVMYTSGTTGMPKGIRFSQRNLVFKRFARALALPEIGEDDVFLCFLPLFHTFGRYLEMLGCVFWGATYCFLESPSVDALVRGMQRHRPTVFISVPKKWMQLHEAVAEVADPYTAPDDELLRVTRELTGGRLRWGLSAAGHLDPDVFRFFQRQGIELLSGFGMTEGTGGITMTPPGEYRDGSLGPPLPGIEARLADDGELVVRGPYVMQGYLDVPEAESGFDADGWFHTGDLMERDADGHFRIVDRKKEIYKNIKGETIAPQRIENLFRDFDSVGRAFLVGDGREYNTLLLYPAPAYRDKHLGGLDAQAIKDHYRSLVVSVNDFLAPYERIVDFAVVDRDLDPARDELTEKGTPRRPQVVRNFEPVIRQLYRRTHLDLRGLDVVLPNWVFQALGLTAEDVRVTRERLVLPGRAGLSIERRDERLARVGSCIYRHPEGPFNLGTLLATPRLWLGNEALVETFALEPAQRVRLGRAADGIELLSRAAPYRLREGDAARLGELLREGRADLLAVHHAACLLGAIDSGVAQGALKLLGRVLAAGDESLTEPARLVLRRAAGHPDPAVARRALVLLVPSEREPRFRATLERFLGAAGAIVDDETAAELAKKVLSPAKLDAFIELAGEACAGADAEAAARAVALLGFLAAYGAAHPASYRRLRALLVRAGAVARRDDAREKAREAAEALQRGFRAWLGSNARIAVDAENGQEYRWDDVVVFDDAVPEEHRARLVSAIKNTPAVREASFLFFKGVLLRLDDIPPGGIWIRPLDGRPGKSVYRVTIQTRVRGGYDLAVVVNDGLSPAEVDEEIRWLVISGEAVGREPLVEDFGGYWKRQDLWSEEFITGETLARALGRLSRRTGEQERFRQIWPFLAWTALGAYVDFWHRSGGLWEIADPSMTNVVVPTDDYHTGVRIVSVSGRRRHAGLLRMLASFVDEFVRPVEARYPALRGTVGWDIVFSSLLEVVGEERGVEWLGEALSREGATAGEELRRELAEFLGRIQRSGFLPRRLHFAVQRYRRWQQLTPEATPEARARMLQELDDTYGISRLAPEYPEARVRLFRETVFHAGPPALLEGLDELISRLRRRELEGDALLDAVAELGSRLRLGEDEDYFLTRISLPYLRPEDAADFVSSDFGGRQQSDVVVSLEDHEGNRFRVRHAMNPKEVGRLYRLFLGAKLDVRFRPEHRYLVAISERQQIIGGIYYEIEEGGEAAHLEKIVVAEAFRRKGVADGLMHEFFNRLRTAGLRAVTTGFFRPEYFYAYGFRIEKRYAGLVKSLVEEPARAPDEPR